MTTAREKLYRAATALSLITIGYNIIEGVVSVWFGLADETLALFGFGLDSLGTLGIAGFSISEGREAFQKARGLACCCAGKCGETA